MAEKYVLREGVVEHAPSSTQYGFTLSGNIPGNARPRGEISVVRLVKPAESGLSHLRQAKRLGDGIKIGRAAKEIVFLLDDPEVVPPQPIVNRQARIQPERILKK